MNPVYTRAVKLNCFKSLGENLYSSIHLTVALSNSANRLSYIHTCTVLCAALIIPMKTLVI